MTVWGIFEIVVVVILVAVAVAVSTCNSTFNVVLVVIQVVIIRLCVITASTVWTVPLSAFALV